MAAGNALIHQIKIEKTLSYVFRNLYSTSEIIRQVNGTTRRGWADDLCKINLLQKVMVNTLVVKYVYLLSREGLNWLKIKNPKSSEVYDKHAFLRPDKIADRIHKHDFEKQHIALAFQKNFHEKFIVRHGAIHRPPMIPKRNFNHVIGMTEFKDKLLKAGNEVLSGSGSKRNGILLTGEPGNGKTTMAESLAGALKLPIISVAFGSFASSWVGQTTERVMKVFDDAERQAPCLLFIDEIEALLIDRSRVSNADSEGPKTVSAILKRLEDIHDIPWVNSWVNCVIATPSISSYLPMH